MFRLIVFVSSVLVAFSAYAQSETVGFFDAENMHVFVGFDLVKGEQGTLQKHWYVQSDEARVAYADFVTNKKLVPLYSQYNSDGIISHKGRWTDHIYPANSIKAFDYALDSGFNGFELDVVISQDQRYVVLHDQKLSYTTDCDGKVYKTVAADIRRCKKTHNLRLPVSALFPKRTYETDNVALLEDVFKRYLLQKRVKHIVVDLKVDDVSSNMDALAYVMRYAHLQNMQKKLIFISKNRALLLKIKQYYPFVTTAIESVWGSEPLTQLEYYLDPKPKSYDMISLNAGLTFGHVPLRRNIIGRSGRNKMYVSRYFEYVQNYDMQTMLWTVNRVSKLATYLDFKPEYVLTDMPPSHVAKALLQ